MKKIWVWLGVVFCGLTVVVGLSATTLAQESSTSFLQTLEAHKPVYLLHSWFLGQEGSAQGYQDKEWIVQFSFKKKIFPLLFFAYSQKMFWQTSDRINSRPFREINYNPELFIEGSNFLSIARLRLGLTEHESNGDRQRYDKNGKIVNDSRTWDRSYLYGQEQITPYLQLGLKLWVVTSPRTDEYRAYFDDNPDMQQYMGSGEVTIDLAYDPLTLTLMFRHGWREKTETVRIDARWPLSTFWEARESSLELHGQYFSGYGDSLRDYDRKVTRFALGMTLR